MPTGTTAQTPTRPQPKDPQARLLLDEKIAQVKAITGDDEKEHYGVGLLVSEILTAGLPDLCGYTSTYGFVKGELGLASSTVSGYVAVARTFPEATAVRFGMTRLQKLITLGKLLQLAPLPAEPAELELLVPPKDPGVEPQPKKFQDCTVSELNRTIALHKKPASGAPAEIAELQVRAQAELDQVCGADSPATIKAHMHGTQVMVELSHVPLEKLPEVLGAIGALVAFAAVP